MAKRFRQTVIVFGAKNGTTIDEVDQEGTNLDCHPIMPMPRTALQFLISFRSPRLIILTLL